MSDYTEHFYSLAIASNAVRLTHHDDRSIAVDNSIVDCVLHKMAKSHGFESYVKMHEWLQSLGPGVSVNGIERTQFLTNQRSK